MEKINVAELLKDCPRGMELDCLMYDNLYFKCIREHPIYPIVCYTIDSKGEEYEISFNWYGKYAMIDTSKCIIFPKGKTTWEGFVPPCKFKDGDMLATDLGSVFYLNTRLNTDEVYGCYVGIGGDGSFHICEPFAYKECCGFATEEEKQKLFKAIKDNGYKWNAETKTLEKLLEPKFKVGDNIRIKGTSAIYVVTEIREDCYMLDDKDISLLFKTQDQWELVPNKFDIANLKPFDKVLVRDSDKDIWCASIFSHTWKDKYFCVGAWHNQCISYEAHKELLGTTNNPKEHGSD